ncbi:RHS repeat protein [Luteibacter aegosomaticola]|uniref:IPT/TIG domain-containing protein n=1 Tax=Luteibacter aegosomaticola TaxID=2911538 RepID=UPI001FF87C30|nr:IPT/TIG domain-containing protein [Luteibacter aegosomaticola]UPG91450.1 RHS repeat protein [Luteibacter aegosomaticola]
MNSQGTRAVRACRMLWALVVLASYFLAVAPARATQYAYDANGRLVAVTADTGDSSRYIYDVMGNIIRIEHVDADALKIFAMIPAHGTYETEVVIAGHGFSSALSDNQVSFNGTPAIVHSATADQLKVSVPYGATSGAVSVTVGGRTAKSDEPFVIDETGVAPTIASVAPDTVAAGDTLTVAGAHLYPIPGKTSFRLNGESLTMSQMTNTSLSAVPAPQTSSGRVLVQTPYGTAESLQTVLVVPPGIDRAKISARVVATLDAAPVAVSVPTSGTMAAVLFENKGQPWVSVQLTGVTVTATYKLYGPGNSLLQQGSVAANQSSIHLSRLKASATYLLLVQPSSSTATYTVAVESPANITSALSTASTQAVSQSRRGIFRASAGDTLSFNVASATTTPANATVTYTIYRPNGASYTSGSATAGGLINLPSLPDTGEYQVVAWPGASAKGSVQWQVISGLTGVLPIDADPVGFDAAAPGQNAYLTFQARAFESVELAFAGVKQDSASSTTYTVSVFGPAGNQVATSFCYTSNAGCELHLLYLAAGTYSVTVVPSSRSTIHFAVAVKRHIRGRAIHVGETLSVNLMMAQAERITFTANAGDNVVLQASAIASAPANQGVRFIIYRPDSGEITSATPSYSDVTSTTGVQLIQLPNLPLSGEYTVLMIPAFGVPASLQLSLVPGEETTLQLDGPPATVATTVSGQSAYLNFTLGDHQPAELSITNFSSKGGQYPQPYIYIYTSAGTVLDSGYCYAATNGGVCTYHLWNLPAGNYRVVVTVPYGGTVTFDAVLRGHMQGGDLMPGQASAYSLSVGQVEHFGFDARSGDTVALNFTNQTTPSGRLVRYIVLRPDAGILRLGVAQYSSIDVSTPATLNLPNLPVDGRYEVLVFPENGFAASGSVTLVSGVTAVIPQGGEISQGTTAGGQNSYITFHASAGTSAELVFDQVQRLTGSAITYFMYVQVFDSKGTNVAAETCQAPTYSTCSYHLWNLAEGNYRIVVTAPYGHTFSYRARIVTHNDGPVVARNSSVDFSQGIGQATHYYFDAQAGETVALRFVAATSPAGRNVRFIVLRPDAGVFRAGMPTYSDVETTGTTINLPNLPVTGRYSVLVIPDAGLPATGSLFVYSGVTGALTDGAPSDIQTPLSGEATYLTFTAAEGESAELVFSNVVPTGATSSYYYMWVSVQDGNGTVVQSSYCTTYNQGGSCSYHLWNLRAGIYRVIVSAPMGGTLSFTAAIVPHVQGRSIAPGQSADWSLPLGGAQYFTIDASAGDALALQITGGTVATGKNIRYILIPPDAGIFRAGIRTLVDSSFSGAKTLSLGTLPQTGRYRLVVMPDFGLSASGRIGMTGSTGSLPPIHSATNLVVNDPVKHFVGAAAGQPITLAFDAVPGDRLLLSFSGMIFTGDNSTTLSVSVYSPDGTLLESYSCNRTDTQCGHDEWNLIEGTYKVVIKGPTAALIALDARVHRGFDRGVLQPNVPTDIGFGSGEQVWLAFNANRGDTVALRLDGVATTPTGKNVVVRVFRPDTGRQEIASPFSSMTISVPDTLNLVDLPASGRYFVQVAAQMALPTKGTLTLLPGAVSTTAAEGETHHIAAYGPSQQLVASFDAGQGGDLNLSFSTISAGGGPSGAYTGKVFDASGRQVDSFTCYIQYPGCFRELWAMAPGIYDVLVTPGDGQTLSFDMVVRHLRDMGQLTSEGSTDYSHSQGETLIGHFTGHKGDTVAVRVDGAATVPAGRTTTLRVYRPGGGYLVAGTPWTSMAVTGAGTLNLAGLPDDGEYTVVLAGEFGLPGAATVTLVPGAVAGSLPEGVVTHAASKSAGQNVYLSFDAGQGGNLLVTLNNVSIVGSATLFYVTVFDANGVQVTSYTCYKQFPGCVLEMLGAAPGRYDMVISPQGMDALSFDGVMRHVRDLGALSVGESVDLTRAAGEMLGLSFDAQIGDTVALQLGGVTSTPAGQNTTVRVYNPDNGRLASASLYSSLVTNGVLTLNLPKLPTSGRYRMLISSDFGVPSTGTLGLYAGITDPKLLDGVIQHFDTQVTQQAIYTSFDASAGDNISLSMGNVKFIGTDTSYLVTVQAPSGATYATFTCYNSYAACTYDFWNMPSGTYRVIVGTPRSSKLSFDAVARRNTERGAMAYGTPVDLTRGMGGVLRMTFPATIGDSVQLQVSGASTSPTSRATTVNVFRPDTGTPRTAAPYKTLAVSKDGTLALPSLPVSGNYTIVVSSDVGLAGSGNITVSKAATP